MSPWQALVVALKAVRTNPLRSGLTMLGIIIGVASVVSVLAIGSGAQTEVAAQIRAVGANVFTVNPGAATQGGARLKAGSQPTLTEGDVAAMLGQIPQIRAAAGSLSGSAQVVHEGRNWNTTVNGTGDGHFLARDWQVAAGRYFSRAEEEGAGKVAILGDAVVKELFKDGGALGAQIRIMSVPFEVVGVLKPKGQDQDDVAFVPLSTAKLRFMGSASAVNRDAVAYILAKAASDEALPEAERQTASLLRQRHHLGSGDDDFKISDPTAVMSAQRGTTRTIALLLAATAAVSLLVGGISIMNIMIVSVTERTREIGIRRAVGARARDIMVQFLSEALVLCLLGGAAGVALGVCSSLAIARGTGWPVVVDGEAIALAVASSGLTGLFFGFYPARRASKLSPIEALKSD